jgi:hypothetical protein
MAGRKAVGATGYFDVQVDVEGPFVKPPHSCFLDGLQVGTGATLGKRNLTWKKADVVVVRVKNTKTNETAMVHLRSKLAELIEEKTKPKADGSDQGHGAGSAEAMARDLALSPAGELFIIAMPKDVAQAEKAKVALIKLMRAKPQAFHIRHDPDLLERTALIPAENHRFGLNIFGIDVARREYWGSIGGGGESDNVFGKFRADERGEWLAEDPQNTHSSAPVP